MKSNQPKKFYSVRDRSLKATASSNVDLPSTTFPLRKNGAGFIALISAIIISAILLVVAVTLSLSSFFARYAILDSEYKARSSALAEGCVDEALLKLANDSSYNPVNEIVTMGSDTCTIRAVDTVLGMGNMVYKIETRGIFQNAYTDLRVKVDPNTLAIIFWQEVPNF